MENTNITENRVKNTTTSIDESIECVEELQLLDVDDIEEDLQIEDYNDAIDANDFLSKLS